MSKFYIRNIFIGLSFVIVLSSAIMNASGPGGGNSNAPGEQNCTNSGCHGGSLITSGSTWNNVRLTGNFTGNGYIPDSTYDIMVSHKHSGKSKFGFQVTVLDQSNNPIGTLTAVGSRNSKTTYNVNGQTRQYIQHTNTGTSQISTDSTNWVFQWKAPSTNVGKVTFYVVVMAANNNGTNDAGDLVHAKTFEVGPSSLLPTASASSSNTTFCTNSGIQLLGSGTNSPTSYSWSMPGGNPTSSTAQNPTVSYFSPGIKNAILTVRNAKGVSKPDTFKITVVPSPPASILNGSAGSICAGDSLLLSANNASGITWQWQHNNASSRTIYIKDTTISYRVKTTSVSTGCTALSGPFKLSWYDLPSVSITRSGTTDSVCYPNNITFTASGSLIDSVIWYLDGNVVQRSKSLTFSHNGLSNYSVQAMAKSTNGCKSSMSNSIDMKVYNKIKPSGISFSKTTNSINLAWDKNPNFSMVHYSLNKVNFQSTDTDSTHVLTGLNPNTKYDITLRAFQAGPCGFFDTTFSITTNACSNISYIVDYSDRTCRGNQINVTVRELFKAKYSISFNNNPFGQDTTFQFTPNQSDSFTITIIDSLNPTCPPIVERRGYTIDVPVDTSSASTAKNISSCANSYKMTLPAGYIFYDYYKNNVLVTSSSDSSFTFNSLITGDKLSAVGRSNTCSKSYGPVNFTLNPSPIAGFDFSRNWKTYTFTADSSTYPLYRWKANSGIIGSTSSFQRDMSDFNNSLITVSLYVENSFGCKDSSSQSVDVPNFSSINQVNNGILSIYPNPVNDVLNIDSKIDGYSIEIVDQIGRQIYFLESGSNQMIISTADWTAGIYHIIIRNDGKEIVKSSFIKS